MVLPVGKIDELLKKDFIFLDGAMGTMLQASGLKLGERPEVLCITEPETIIDIHKQYINAGAVLRVTPIKDVKTMIQAFDFAKKQVKNLKLWIMGPTDEDEKYAK